uniref:NADH-ubiquinone oxidoreductase chain 6 n=2 Tax=Phaneropterinae TaxID=117677 RepID=A0A1J0M4F0_9ORTH|nr:NADH dehydrogenase subunit 6 [Phaneroptera gracilis]APD14872.1 NADH dehydrogenase subunit 6 [Ducetia sp. NS-2016]ARN59030.1 NADH dehydrogenase subunit 6 [Phaneroptera gracilis]
MQFTFITSILLTCMFMLISHPLAMTLTIILQTLLICLTVSTFTHSSLFAYILFLVFLGGMLVLFIYITSLAANEMFTPMIKYAVMFSIILFILMIINMLFDSLLTTNLLNNPDMLKNETIDMSANEPIYLLTKLYNTPTKIMTVILVIYLFLTLIAVVKITNIFLGPLRQKY